MASDQNLLCDYSACYYQLIDVDFVENDTFGYQ